MLDEKRFSTLKSYEYPTRTWRAQPLYVVDGDTADLFVDRGLHHYTLGRVRFLDIDTADLNSKDKDQRAKAQNAKKLVQGLLDTHERTSVVDLKFLPLRIETARAPDIFGRWLCRIFATDDDGEQSVSAELLDRGLAVPYEK